MGNFCLLARNNSEVGTVYLAGIYSTFIALLSSNIQKSVNGISKGGMMKLTRILALSFAFLVAASASMADSVTLRNADHMSGTIVTSDGKDLTLKTDYAGEIKIQWAAVKEVSSDKPLYVVTADNKTVTGVITTDGTNLIVHTTAAGEVARSI